MYLSPPLTLGFLDALVTVSGDLDALRHDLLVGFGHFRFCGSSLSKVNFIAVLACKSYVHLESECQ